MNAAILERPGIGVAIHIDEIGLTKLAPVRPAPLDERLTKSGACRQETGKTNQSPRNKTAFHAVSVPPPCAASNQEVEFGGPAMYLVQAV